MKNKLLPILIFTLTTLGSVRAVAQNYSISWFKIGGGGGTISGGGYTLSGTVGQPDAGNLAGGNFSLTGGFWSIVQSSGAPVLQIKPMDGAIIVSWPLSAIGYNLEQASVPVLPNSWTTISPPYSTNTTSSYLRIVSPTGQSFFRLHKP